MKGAEVCVGHVKVPALLMTQGRAVMLRDPVMTAVLFGKTGSITCVEGPLLRLQSQVFKLGNVQMKLPAKP